MQLSEQQMGAVMHGMAKRAPFWRPMEFPAGPQQLPAWLLDANVDLMLHASNAPDVKFKVKGDPWSGPKLYENEGDGAWTARSEDGFVMTRHYHSGHVTKQKMWRILYDGKPFVHDWQLSERDATQHLANCMELQGRDPNKFEITWIDALCTAKENGYGGRQFPIELKTGETLILRGPWHGGPPVGWTEAYTFDVSDPYNARPYVVQGKNWPWYQRGGTFGYFFSDELVLKAVARYMPHLGAALVYPGYGRARLEFYDLNWGAPKKFAKERLPGWGPAEENDR